MDREAWTDSALVQEVLEGFVPVRVDEDRRPDVADRYLAGGWPTTAVLTSDGQFLAAQTVVEAGALRLMLRQIRDVYRKNRTEITSRAADSARRVAETWRSDSLTAPGTPLSEWVDQNLGALRDAEDKENGGLLGTPKLPQFEAVTFLLDASESRSDPELRALGLRVLDAAMSLEDSLWGGFYRFASDASWKKPHTEKLLDVNARALGALVRAVEAKGGTRYRAAARRTEAYATRWLWDGHAGGWYGSQDADVLARDGSGRRIAGEVYYGLSKERRLTQGVPRVDSTLYTDANARMASAVLRGAAAGLWKEAPVARAVRALDRLWSDRRAPDGSLYHAWAGGRATLPGLLADQAAAGLAYLDAYRVTKEPRHLERAKAVASWIQSHLEDPVGGGFRYAPRDTAAIGRLAAGDKPEAANVEAARLFLGLWQIGHRSDDRRSAERALAHLRSGDVVVLDPQRASLGLALERMGDGAVPAPVR